VGAKRAIEDAVTWLSKKGTVVIVGMPSSDVSTNFNPSNLAAFGQSIIGSKMGSAHIRRDIPWLVRLYQEGKLKLDEMVSQHYTLDSINEAIASTKSGSALRNVVMFD
jgi:S-(hydroxymethyl)glutathione dehydrogenase/alcohol dehydrogenase